MRRNRTALQSVLHRRSASVNELVFNKKGLTLSPRPVSGPLPFTVTITTAASRATSAVALAPLSSLLPLPPLNRRQDITTELLYVHTHMVGNFIQSVHTFMYSTYIYVHLMYVYTYIDDSVTWGMYHTMQTSDLLISGPVLL